jgi:limonene-1,2-epoxide hydrolase
MPEITTITSESLQAEVRRLLPSQRGFGTDLEAQNVIVPIVDLTPTAEGSALREDLQTAASFGAISTATRDNQATGGTNVVTTPGFYKYETQMAILSDNVASVFETRLSIIISATGANKVLHELRNSADASGQEGLVISATGIAFLKTGEALRISNTGVDTFVCCSAWPIADVNGNLINPSGFSFE